MPSDAECDAILRDVGVMQIVDGYRLEPKMNPDLMRKIVRATWNRRPSAPGEAVCTCQVAHGMYGNHSPGCALATPTPAKPDAGVRAEDFPTIARLADPANTTVGYQQDYLVEEAVRLFRVLAAPRELVAKARTTREYIRPYADFLQRRGAALDIVLEALNEYDSWMVDDDYDAHSVLRKIMDRMRERYALFTAPREGQQSTDGSTE